MQNEFGGQEAPLSYNEEVIRIRKVSECSSSTDDEIDIESETEGTQLTPPTESSEPPAPPPEPPAPPEPPIKTDEHFYSLLPVPKQGFDTPPWSSSPEPPRKETSPKRKYCHPKESGGQNKSSFVQGVLHMNTPKGECNIDKNNITPEEREINREFFLGHTQKTPERYVKIRNYILECWDRSKPNYVNKTSVRSGLRSCGDVNSIGRVHTYLEMVGAINFGCDQVHQNRKALQQTSSPLFKKSNQSHNNRGEDGKRPRKRKHPVELSGDEPEGYTFHHDENGEVTEITTSHGTRPVNQLNQPAQPKSRGANRATTLKLVPTARFSPEHPAPYTVELCVTTMLVVDVHAHLQDTEVMGLLGGHYLSEEKRLVILAAEPCESTSTGLECEMDPVSQNQAAEALQQGQGLQVVGWYHSHPTFFPSPSVRDITTQASFQGWFSEAHPFVGLIVSPYVTVDTEPVSRWKCISLGEESTQVGSVVIQRPYQFDFIVNGTSLSETEVVSKVAFLSERLASLPNTVAMWCSYPPIPGYTYLDKLLKSAEKTLEEGDVLPETASSLLFQIRQILGQGLEDESNS